MIIGDEDHREDIPVPQEKNFKALEQYIQDTFPGLNYTVVRNWCGPILEPIDGIAYIGKHEGIYYATGFSGTGMTYAGIATTIFKDSILNKGNPWKEVYDPSRNIELMNILRKGKDYSEEFIKGAGKNIFK